jgi:type IX secretion system PorP/SprF family membrane protein
MKRIALTAAIMMIVAFSGFAQQDPLISQYMFNPLLVNPAYAGSKDYAMASAMYRDQWVGLPGAPKTMLASLNGPVFTSRKVGLGLTLADDNIGITNRYSITGNYAYQIPLNNNFKLGLGISTGIFYQTNNLAAAQIDEAGDRVYQGGRTNEIIPEAGTGVYLHNDKFYAEVSITNLVSYDKSRPLSINNSGDNIYPYVRSYWLGSGYAFEINPDFVIRPSIMVRYTEFAPVQGDLNCNVLLKKILWLGVTFRSGDAIAGNPEAIVGLVEFQITKQMRIGYSYDFTLSALNSYSNGTHEITIGYDFGYDVLKMKSPRYF